MYIYSYLVEAILFLVYILYDSGGNHALRKTSYLPNHVCYPSAVYLRRKLTFTALFWVRLKYYQFDTFFNPKNASETNATNTK